MKSVEQNLTQYAAYHRDRRNIATHFVGIPMIVFAIVLALALVDFPLGTVTLTGATLLSVALCLYYFVLDRVLGVAMAIAFFVLCAAASEVSARFSSGATLCIALAVFAAGWGLQFLGHKYEGMKPAFFDDARQLFIGPLFVCAEAFFLCGGRPRLRRYVEERVGPTVPRRDGAPLRAHAEPATRF